MRTARASRAPILSGLELLADSLEAELCSRRPSRLALFGSPFSARSFRLVVGLVLPELGRREFSQDARPTGPGSAWHIPAPARHVQVCQERERDCFFCLAVEELVG